MTLTLVIPVYKEHLRFESSLRQIVAFMAEEKAQGVEIDVVFVDDGSPEASAAVINDLISDRNDPRMRLLRYAVNQGKGYAVRTGILAAEGELILMSDADLSTPLQDWRKLKDALDAGADIACGSRAVRGAHIGKPPPFHRRVLSRIFNLLVRLAGVHNFKDTQCGFKLFHAEPAKIIFERMRTRRFAFDVEMIAMARDLGYNVAEVPVRWDYSGHSTVKVFSSGSRMLIDLLLLAARRWIFGRTKMPNAEG